MKYSLPVLLGIISLALLSANAETRYFVAGQTGALDANFGYYVVPISNPDDIATAREQAAIFPTETHNDSLLIVLALIKQGVDGVNRNYQASSTYDWDWYVTEFLGFTSTENYDPDIGGYPDLVSQEIDDWIANTYPDDDSIGKIGFLGIPILYELPLQWTSMDESGIKFSWFGAFEDSGWPWIFHAQYGWLYIESESPFDIWFCSLDRQSWFWMTETDGSLVYDADASAWLYRGPDRWAFNFQTQQWAYGEL